MIGVKPAPLPSPAEWSSLDELKAELQAKLKVEDKDCWDSGVGENGATNKATISSNLYGSKTKLPKIKVRIVDGRGGVVEREFTVGTNGVVRIPRKKNTPWSEIKHAAFVKHGPHGPITFHPDECFHDDH